METRYEVRFVMVDGVEISHTIRTTPRGIRKILFKAQKGRTLLFDNPSGAWLVFCDKAIEISFKELEK